MNKKKKSTNTSPYPDEVIDRLARAFHPAILACWNSKEGQREFAAWQAEQAHLAGKEKQEVPAAGERPVIHIAIACGFFRVRPIQGRTLFFYYDSSFSTRSIRYPTPTWVWIRCGASGHRSNFLRRDAM